jgi:Endonuclease NucS C-terminal domain
MAIYLCTVTSRFPENYEIGIRSGTWGVEEKYKEKIEPVHSGDKLVFVMGGIVRSVHTIADDPFFDKTPLWPPKDGSIFPYRVHIHAAEWVGTVSLAAIADQISFMRGKVWGGTIQGPNGVFNPKLTQSDLGLIIGELNRPVQPKGPLPPPQSPIAAERQKTLFKFYEKDIEDRLIDLLPSIGLTLYQDENSGRSGRQFICEVGRIDLLCTSAATGDLVIIELKKGQAPNETLLQILRYMSWVRQNLSGRNDVKGIILTESADSTLEQILGEVPNVSIQYYSLSITLHPRAQRPI